MGGSDDEYFEDDDIDVDIDIVDPPIVPKNNEGCLTDVQLNKEIKLSLLLSQKDSLIKYLDNINVNKELVQLLNENINLIISNQIDEKNKNDKKESDNNNNNNNSSNNKTISINQSLNIDNEYVKNTQAFLSETVSLYHKINSKDSIVNNKNDKDVYRIKRFKRVLEEPKFDIPTIHSEIVQVTAPKEDIEKRVKTFTTSKKLENGKYNIVEFIEDSENDVYNGSDAYNNNNHNNTSRCSAIPPSKMKITKTYNLTGPLDNISSSSIQQPFIDDRLSILENHLKLVVPPVPIDIYQRVKLIEQKMIALEEKNPTIFKELYDTMKQNSTVDHTTTTVNKVLKQNINSNNNNNNNYNTTTTTTTTTTSSNSNSNRNDKTKITFKIKK
ncbi:hypothetical protein ACTFIU_007435 [Dictyostelium citrinum]